MQPTLRINSNVQAIAMAGSTHPTETVFRRIDSGCRTTGACLQRLQALLGPSPVADKVTKRSEYKRLALPYVFRPSMSMVDASAAVATIFTRIFLGCLLFAVWGTYTMVVWSSIPSHFWRTTAMLSLAVLFVFLLGLLMLGISAVASAATRRAHSGPSLQTL